MPMEEAVRVSNLKEDCEIIARKLSETMNISPYNVEQLGIMLSSSFKVEDIRREKRGSRWYICDIDRWFSEKVLPNTVVLTKSDYQVALYRAFNLLVKGNIARTDFGSSRQRDFGQMWTDFTRGYLGEIGMKKFMKARLDLDVELEELRIGEVQEFIQRDIVKVKEGVDFRNVRTKISVKTSKLNALWLDIGNQISHSDFFVFIKIGLKTDHYTTYMKESGAVEKLLREAVQAGELQENQLEYIKNELFERIPDFRELPVYVAGYASKQDLESGRLDVEERVVRKRSGETVTVKTVIGGMGYYDEDTADEVLGLGDIGVGKHLASINSLKWMQEDWNKVKEKI